MPVARKTKAGTWRCQAFDRIEIVDGKKKYIHKSFTARTKYEAEQMANKFLQNKNRQSSELTLTDAIDKYIEIKKNTLSPSTISGYRDIQKNYFGILGGKRLDKITSEDVQAQINALAATHREKTCRNTLGLFTAVMSMFIPDKRFYVYIPIRNQPEYSTPSDSDIEKLLSEIKSFDLRKAILLSAFGTMRRSEICGLKYSDVEGNVITVRRAKVKDENHRIVLKGYPKNASSNRAIVYPNFVIDEILKDKGEPDDFIIKVRPDSLTSMFIRARERAGLSFRFHDLRAYSASIAHAIGIPDSYIMERGGWKSDATLKRVYRRTISDKSKEMSEKINDYYSEKFSEKVGNNKSENEKP